MSELKPCPFCGGKAKKEYVYDLFWCQCESCFAYTIAHRREQRAIDAWNNRYDSLNGVNDER